MIGMLLEAVVLAFVIGGIVGAVTALHLSNLKKVPVRIQNDNLKKVPVRVQNDNLHQGRRRPS